MSELITNDRRNIRWQLLTTASAMALIGYTFAADPARAEDSDRPTVWIELGGQVEAMQNTSAVFTAPFMSPVNPPDFYKGNGFISDQRPPGLSLGFEGKVTVQPHESDWVFSAGIRYGRAHANRHTHNQIPGPTATKYFGPSLSLPYNFATPHPFHDTKVQSAENHLVVDFSAGRDVGVGSFGHDGSSTINAGVRLVDLKESSMLSIYARPSVNVAYVPPKYQQPAPTFHQYIVSAHSEHGFRGVGPSLSWNASSGLLGNAQSGELMLDWGVNAAVLFGRQKTKVDHHTSAYHHAIISKPLSQIVYANLPVYDTGNHSTRTRSATVPNLGGFAGVSVRYPNARVSLGYRADFFFGAVDGGIDTRKSYDRSFYGPFASVSIGLGG